MISSNVTKANTVWCITHNIIEEELYTHITNKNNTNIYFSSWYFYGSSITRIIDGTTHTWRIITSS
jgi:hypothetical protein